MIRDIPTHFSRTQRRHLVEVRAGQYCPRCGGPVCYSVAPRSSREVGFHRPFCMRCDEWLEEECGTYPCPVCRNRPYRPSAIEGRTVVLNPGLLD